jgi:NitT/TauT family transport system ATP-binding protein
MVELVGLSGFEDAWPRDLSGGMAQRWHWRGRSSRTRICCCWMSLLAHSMPLTRERMGAELLSLWQTRRKTVLMVTHSISEVILLSDRVLVMTPRPGRICLDLAVDLPRPRAEEIRYTPEFGVLARRLRAAIG